MKKVFLLLTLFASTISAWASSSNANLYIVCNGHISGSYNEGRIALIKNNDLFTYTGYFYQTATNNGIKFATANTGWNCFHPTGGSTDNPVFPRLKRDSTYNMQTASNPDNKISILTSGWYTITFDQSKTPETLKVSSESYPAALYPVGECFNNAWSRSVSMTQTASNSGIYEKYLDFKQSSEGAMKFACMSTSDKTMLGPVTSGQLISGPGTYDLKHYAQYYKPSDGKNYNDIKFKVTSSSAVTYFVRVTLKNPTNHTFKLEIKNKPTLAFTSNPNNKVYTDAPFNVVASSTNSTGAITYSSSDPSVASVDANTGKVTLHVPGTTKITAKVAETSSYGPLSIDYTLTVTGIAPTSQVISRNMSSFGFTGEQHYYYFKLDDVISVKSSNNNAKYLNESGGLMRYYQDNNKGEFTIRAKAGVIIQSITIDYSYTGVLTNVWQNDGKSVADANQVKTGVPFSVGANYITLYVGSTGDNTGKQVRISKMTVKYFDPNGASTVIKCSEDLKVANNWANWQVYKDPVAINNAITWSSTDNIKYYPTNIVRSYSWCGALKLQARSGAKILYAMFSYVPQDNQGVLTKLRNGINIPAANQIASDSMIFVNAESFTIYAGASGSSGKYVDINKVCVIYEDNNAYVDNLYSCTSKGKSGSEDVVGVKGVYNWQLTNFKRDSLQRIYNDQSILINKGGKIATVGDEGGIKEMAFDWHAAEKNKAVKFTVKGGGATEVLEKAAMADTYVMSYVKKEQKSNGAFSIEVDANSGTQLEVGHFSLTPYLLYTNKLVSIDALDYSTVGFKYKNAALINNTGGTVTYSVSGENADKIAKIDAADVNTGYITLLGAGTVTVTASWEGVTTSYNLTINLHNPGVSFDTIAVTKMISEGTYKQELNKGQSSGAVTYSLVSAPDDKATIDPSSGEVTFSTAGEYAVRGKVAAALPYAEDSATYTLTVTELSVPTLKFDTSYVEKPVGAAGFINPFSKPDDDTGAVTYSSSETGVATVVADGDGTVTIVGAGTTTITASVAETSKYAADSKSYTLKVFPLSDISFADEEKNVYLNADPFTYAVTKTAGDGEITYDSSDKNVAEVDNDGKVTVKGSGTTIITANIAKTDNYWSGTANYTLNVSSLKMPTASFGTETVVNKVQNFESFTKTAETESDGTKHYYSSDKRVATVDETTGAVTKGEKPGTTIISVSLDASTTWEALNNAAQYTLNVSSAPIADMDTVSKTVGEIKGTATWANESMHPNTPINNVITLSNGKFYNNSEGGEFRYYYQEKQYATSQFTLQAKAGVIIKSVKFTYTANDNTVLTDEYCYGSNVPAGHEFYNGVSHAVDANAITFYVGKTSGSSAGTVTLKAFEITYFDPSEGVAVTKTASDIAKDMGIGNEGCADELVINQAASIHIADPTYSGKTLRYYTSGPQFNMYVHTGGIDVKARKGAKIHYLKITYSRNYNAVLTKYFGTNGYNIPAVDCIASDSIIYVNADSIRLYAGTTNPAPVAQQYPSVAIKKIYVNYTDGEEVVVDNFDNCTAKSGDSVVVAGVDNKYTWTLKKFARDNAQRMYYDQSIKLSAGGAIYTPISGALKEVAFDWHPTEANKQVKFYVKAGSETITVDSTMNGTYTINFKKADIQDNDTFAISVDGQSATTLEIGHVSLTPYITYAQTKVEIDAKDYEAAGWKYTNSSLINNTGAPVAYTLEGSSDVAVIEDASSGEVTIKGAGTVTVIATADGKSARYSLTINLASTQVSFETKHVEKLITAADKTYTQTLTETIVPPTGKEIIYSIVADPADGAEIDPSTGKVTYSKIGTYVITGSLTQTLPYAAAFDTYTLSVQAAETPTLTFQYDSIAKDLHADVFSNPLDAPVGVGKISYTSSDDKVATVTNEGNVTIKGTGKATITVNVEASEQWAAASKSYILYVKPLPEMSFAHNDTIVYLNTTNFTNKFTISEGAGKVTYSSDKVKVATVNEESGEITVVGAGTAIITANSEEATNFSAGTKYYTLTVKDKIFVTASFEEVSVTKKHTDGPFQNKLNQSPKSDGEVSYTSSDKLVATVDNTGKVTLQGRIASTTITATIAGTDDYEEATASYVLTVNEDPTPGGETVNGNIATIASKGGWQNNQYRTYFKIDENISVSSAANNSQYQKSDESVRFYQKTNKGEFTIRAKAGVIIQAVKFNYSSTNNGVITNNYGDDGKSIAAANQYVSGTTYKFDANKLTFYTGSTGTADNADVHITSIVVKYFKPNMGVAVTKTMGDIGHQYKYKTDNCPQTVAVNNVISMKVNNSGTQKYLIGENICEFRYYQNSGPVTFQARKGAKIHYLKISYSSINNGVLNKFSANNNIPLTDQIASDSVIYVNDNSLTLYVGCTGTGSNTQARINKVYVVYTDSTASVDNFDQLTEIYGGATAKEVAGVDGVYSWKITQFNRDSLRRIGYDQSIMLRQNGGKIETVTDEGGVKEVSFDWFASDKTKGVKFAVNAGGQTITVDSAAANGYYPMTFTATEIKKNGAFSIEVDGTSGSQLEFGHISLTPYLLYKTKEATIDLGESYKNTDLINNTDGESTITYSFDGTGDVAEDGTITPEAPGDYTVTATWGNVSTTYTLKVSGTLTLNEADDNAAKIAANEGKKLDVVIGRTFKAGMYNTICLPFDVSKTDLATAFGRTITSLAQYTQTASLDDAHKNLNVEIEDVEAIEAGNPYLLQFEGEDVTNPEFAQVTIVNTTGNTVGQGGTTQFIGTIGKKNIGAKENSVLFVIANNKLAWNNTGQDSHMNGFRAYFNVPDMSDQSVAARLVFRQPATPTELMQNAQCTMQGVQKMIINNQLIIIREGKMYNAQGAEF